MKLFEQKRRSFAQKKCKLLLPLTLLKPIESTETLIFLHIPKTGGTNLYFIAEAHVDIRDKRISVPKQKGQSPNLITPGWQGGFSIAEASYRANPNVFEHLDFLSGHFPFGIHHFMPKSNVRYISLLRDPIERALSSLNFDYQRGDINAAQAMNYLLHADIDNPQTRLLAGIRYMTGDCDESVLKVAQDNIKSMFLLVGVTEDTNTFIRVSPPFKAGGASPWLNSR